MEGLTAEHLTRENSDDEDTPILSIPFKVAWQPTWVRETTVLTTPSGKTTIDNYNTSKAPKRKKPRTSPPAPPQQPVGWHPLYTTFTTKPINPDLDAIPTGAYEITHHPSNTNEALLHAPDGRLITTITKARLRKLNTLHDHTNDTTPLPEALANLTHRHTTIHITHQPTIETKLHKPYKPQQHAEPNGTWTIPDTLYDALHQCFDIQRVIHCNPINLPLRAKTYISHDTRDTHFGATPYTRTAWPSTSLALPDYTPHRMKQALEQAIYSAHAHRHTSPSSHILILPNWEHSPYLARNLHTTYAQKITSIPYYPIYSKQPNNNKPKLNIYLIANEKALSLLNHQHILATLRPVLTTITGKPAHITINLTKKDPQHIDSHTSYTEQYPYTPTPPSTPQHLSPKPFHPAWNPKSFIYTDGSQKRETPL